MKKAIVIGFMVLIVAVGCQKDEIAPADTIQTLDCIDGDSIDFAKIWSWDTQPDVQAILIEDLRYMSLSYWHMKDILTVRTSEDFCECQGTLILTATKQEFPLRWRVEQGSLTLDGKKHQLLITEWKPEGVY